MFTRARNSSRRYCDLHIGGRLAVIENQPDNPTDYHELLDQFGQRLQPLPPIPNQVLATRREEMGFDTPQEAIALFSDLHWGSWIDPRVTAGLAKYDLDIARDRLIRWRDILLRFTQMDQYLVDVDTLHLFALGDDLEGHGQMFATQKLEMADSVGFALFSLLDHLPNALLSLLARYKKIKVYKVRGNHGRITARAKDDYPPDNLELMLWSNVADRVRRVTGGEWTETANGIRVLEGGKIDFYISPAFMMFVDIMGYTFAIRHGDRVGGVTRTYTGLVDNKLRLNAIVGSTINYYMIAHHHEAQNIENEIGGEAIVNGCFVGPSLLSVTMSRPAANIPSQEFFLVHPKYGLTHRHRIRLATVAEMRELIEWTGRKSFG
jgi:hypothetical protein